VAAAIDPVTLSLANLVALFNSMPVTPFGSFLSVQPDPHKRIPRANGQQKTYTVEQNERKPPGSLKI
jgi:hypothetical protein